jgi:hypothetical protein
VSGSSIPDPTIPLIAAAKFLSISPERLRELADAGEIPCDRGGLKLPLLGTIGAAAATFRFSDLMKYLQARQRALDHRARRR